MPTKTISKKLIVVIAVSLVSMTFSACGPDFKGSGPKDIGNDGKSDDYARSRIVGEIASPDIKEASGIAASRCRPDVFWTHNDSGDGPYLFAINPKGETLGVWRVDGAENLDWEDIAAAGDGKNCEIYIGEIGNNELKRSEMKIYRIREPEITSGSTDRESAAAVTVAETIVFRYPDGPKNSETLLVHPKTRTIYVLTKSRKEASGVYRIVPKPGNEAGVEKIGEVSVPALPDGLITGGDISPDGTRVILCDYFSGYELKLPENAKSFDEIWKSRALTVEIGDREIGEAICYTADGRALIAISEKLRSPVIRIDHR